MDFNLKNGNLEVNLEVNLEDGILKESNAKPGPVVGNLVGNKALHSDKIVFS
jgi:hypothetical protein